MDDRVFHRLPHVPYHRSLHILRQFSIPPAPRFMCFTKWDVELFLATTEKEKLTAGMFATPMVMMLLDSPDSQEVRLSPAGGASGFAGAGNHTIRLQTVHRYLLVIFSESTTGTTESNGCYHQPLRKGT